MASESMPTGCHSHTRVRSSSMLSLMQGWTAETSVTQPSLRNTGYGSDCKSIMLLFPAHSHIVSFVENLLVEHSGTGGLGFLTLSRL